MCDLLAVRSNPRSDVRGRTKACRHQLSDDLRGGLPLSGAALEDLFHLFARHRQFVDVIAQPRGEIGLDSVGPTRIDLARGVLFFAQPLVAEAVAQLGDLGVLHYFFGKLRRDEHDAAVPSQDNVAGQHGGAPNADGDVDADHGRVHAVARREVAEVVRRVVGTDEGSEILQLLQAVYVAHGAVVHDAVAAPRIDGVADVVADGRAILLQPEMVADVNIAGLEHVHRPGVLPSDAPIDLPLLLDHPVDIGTARQPLRGQRAAHQHLAGMDDRAPVIVVLVAVRGLLDDGPSLLQGDRPHALQYGIGHLGTPVGEALTGPLGGVLDELFAGENSGLGKCGHGQQHGRNDAPEIFLLHGDHAFSNQGVPGTWAWRAPASLVSTPRPARSGRG